VKAGVEKVGPMVTKVPVKLGGANVSVFGGTGSLKEFELGNPQEFKSAQAMKVGDVDVSISPGSLLGDKVVVRYVRVKAPEITFEQSHKGNNLSKILENVQSIAGTTSGGASTNAAPGKKLQVDEFVITGGKITIAATALGGKGATLPLPEIKLSNLGQGPEGITPAELIEKVLSSVTASTIKAVAEGAGALAKEGLDIGKKLGTESVDAAKSGATKATEKLGNLFKKK
jgi:uncharacterized protein involved in outer membrane biogenesis